MAASAERPVRFLVADDHPIVRLGVRQQILSAWPGALIDEADTVDMSVRQFQAHRPDLIVLDLMMPDTSGTEAAVRMLRVAGGVPILVLSANAEQAYASLLLRMGISGYLPKDKAADELVAALRRLLAGKRYVTPAMADHLVDMIGAKERPLALHEQLSIQEYRVMVLIAAGLAPAAMARTMGLSVKTVGTYRARVFEKTGWKSTAELTRYCMQHGLADPN
ncbi:MAG: response regulator transcription factor [Pseudomonadota bacterium]|nr:response regulator transcription factor [Pseudomonadota bacterium]